MEVIVIAAAVLVPVFLLFFWIGHRRIRFGTGKQVAAMCAGALLAAFVCFLIGDAKTGGFLAGLVGFVMMLVLAVGAAGLAIGAGFATRRAVDEAPPQGARADLVVFGLFLSAALLASLMESGGSGGHH